MDRNADLPKTDKTGRALMRAFADYLYENSYFEPTVTQIIQRAEISKPTFYRRFSDIDSFTEETIRYSVSTACRSVYRFEEAVHVQKITEKKVSDNLLKYAGDVHLMKAIIHSRYSYDFSNLLMRSIKEHYDETERVRSMSPVQREKFYLYISSVISGCYLIISKRTDCKTLLDSLLTSEKILLPVEKNG